MKESLFVGLFTVCRWEMLFIRPHLTFVGEFFHKATELDSTRFAQITKKVQPQLYQKGDVCSVDLHFFFE